jgi:hypothetical protein
MWKELGTIVCAVWLCGHGSSCVYRWPYAVSPSADRSNNDERITYHSHRKVGKRQCLFRTTEPWLRIEPYQIQSANNAECMTVYHWVLLLMPRILRGFPLSPNSLSIAANAQDTQGVPPFSEFSWVLLLMPRILRGFPFLRILLSIAANAQDTQGVPLSPNSLECCC